MSREELKEIARQIIDYKRGSDRFQILKSLSEEDSRALIPILDEVTKEQIAKDRAHHEAFMKKEMEFNRKVEKFIAEEEKFIAKVNRDLSRRRYNFPFAIGEA